VAAVAAATTGDGGALANITWAATTAARASLAIALDTAAASSGEVAEVAGGVVVEAMEAAWAVAVEAAAAAVAAGAGSAADLGGTEDEVLEAEDRGMSSNL
jgi:hypothetical protein